MWGGRIQKRKGSYIWPRDFVPVLKQLLVPVGVLISRLCNQRTLFSPSLLKAQQRQNHPSHQSPKNSDHLSPVSSLLLYRIFDSDLFAAMILGLILSPQFESSGRQICRTFAGHRTNLPLGSVYHLITPPHCDI